MFDKFLFTCNSVLPVVLTILTGYLLKKLHIFEDDFFKKLNKLSFRCCLPTMLFYNVYNIDRLSTVTAYGKITLFCFTAIFTSFLISAILFGLFMKDNRQKGVMVQAAYRSNNAIIGLSLVSTLVPGNLEAISLASVLSSIFIPMFNFLAVISLTMYVHEEGKGFNIKSTVKKIITNPLIIGTLSGFAVLVIRYFIPEVQNTEGVMEPVFTVKNNLPFLYRTIQMVGGCATTIALIALGGTFTFSAIARLKTLITIGTLLRVAVVPVTALTAAYFMGFRELEFPSLIALLATPTAVSSVPMATEMNNDDELAGQIVVWTSIMSAFTLFAIIFVCAQVGIFQV